MSTNANGSINYPSITKPWLKYYDKEAIDGSIPQMKIYDYAKSCIDQHGGKCYSYFDKDITSESFLQLVDITAKAYRELGVTENEIVSILSPTIPEAIISVYALNRLGAIANLIDPRLGLDNIIEKIKESKIVVSVDLAEPKVNKALTENQTVIYFSVSESFPVILKYLYKFKSARNKKVPVMKGKVLRWKEFMLLGKKSDKPVKDSAYKPNAIAIIESTSGTTGKSKLAQLTNENVNAVAWQYGHAGILFNPGDIFLNIMPMFLSYGIVAGIHMPLCLGFKNVIIPQRDLKKMAHYILKYKPASYLDIPTGFEMLMKSPLLKNKDLSFLRNPGVGGDYLNPELEIMVNEFLHAHGCRASIQKGYGMTEVSSAAVVNVAQECNTVGSVGIPFSKTTVKIVDPDTYKELPIGETGELHFSSPAIFAGYYKNDEATKKEIYYDSNGVKWLKSGDYFYMAPNGELFFKGRMKEMFVRPDGHNNHPTTMTHKILEHPAVKDAYTVGVPSPWHHQGKWPKAVVVLHPQYKGSEETIQSELEKMCIEAFSWQETPYFYEFVDELPMTPNGKVDFRQLEANGLEHAKPAQICLEINAEFINKQ